MTPSRRRPPLLLVVVELEELPVVRLFCDTLEDEARLRGWLAGSAARRRLMYAVEDAINDLMQEAA